jgi:hypothetical protein
MKRDEAGLAMPAARKVIQGLGVLRRVQRFIQPGGQHRFVETIFPRQCLDGPAEKFAQRLGQLAPVVLVMA